MVWTLVRVGDLAEQIRGVTFGKSDATKQAGEGLIPVMTATNITENGLHTTSILHIPKSKAAPKQMLRKNDLIITASSGSLSVVGRAVLVRGDVNATFGAFCKVLRPTDQIDPDYFSHYFRTPHYRSTVARLAAGANINNLRNEDLDNLEIPLPPLPEQRRIASILDATDQLRTTQVIALAYIDAVIDEAFRALSAQVAKRMRLGDCAAISAELVDPRRPEFAECPLVAPDNIEPKTGRVHNVRTVAEIAPISGKYQFQAEDVLYSKIRPALNKVALAETSGLCSADMYPLRVDEKILIREYLWGALRSPEFLRYASGMANRAQMPKLNRNQLFGYSILVPPISMQRQFACIVSDARLADNAIRRHQVRLDELFASLQYRAFRGEL